MNDVITRPLALLLVILTSVLLNSLNPYFHGRAKLNLNLLLYTFHPIILYIFFTNGVHQLVENLAISIAICSFQFRSSIRLAMLSLLFLGSFIYISPVQGLVALFTYCLLTYLRPKESSISGFQASSSTITKVFLCGMLVFVASLYCVLATESHPFMDKLRPLEIRSSSRAPETGLSWYILVSTFLRQLPYFVPLLWIHPFLYFAPIAYTVGKREPAVAMLLSCAFASIFDPSSAYSLARIPLVTMQLVSMPHVCYFMNRLPSTLAGGIATYAAIVAPFMKYYWMSTNAGNANHLFIISLIFSFAASSLLVEVLLASVMAAKLKKVSKG